MRKIRRLFLRGFLCLGDDWSRASVRSKNSGSFVHDRNLLALERPLAFHNRIRIESLTEVVLLRVFVVEYRLGIATDQDSAREYDITPIRNGQSFPFAMIGQ